MLSSGKKDGTRAAGGETARRPFGFGAAQGLGKMQQGFAVEGRTIGPGAACFVIAEAGVNHNGDPALAHRLVEAAAEAGADAVKFQTFDPALLASERAELAAYQRNGSGRDEGQLAMLRGLALGAEDFAALRTHCAEKGIVFLSSPFDEASADLLERLGAAAFKLASGELTNPFLLRHLARKGRPLILSTGMATLEEVEQAVGWAGEAGCDALALLHCVSDYPADPAEANLRAMDSLAAAFGLPIGFSDHTPGLAVALAAAARGAAILEKHLTLDRALPGPDHRASLEPGALRELIAGLRTVEAALGDGRKRPSAREEATAAAARRSLHLRRDVPAGRPLAIEDLTALRPGTGIPPDRYGQLLGRSLRADRAAGHALAWSDLA